MSTVDLCISLERRHPHDGSGPPLICGRNRNAPLPLEENRVDIWRIDLDGGTVRDDIDGALLAPHERIRAERIPVRSLRQRFVNGRSALRSILAGYLEVEPLSLSFAYGPAGKPRLQLGSGMDLRFNASHSGPIMLVAVGTRSEIGVDIEDNQMAADVFDLADRFFSSAEQQAMTRLPEARAAQTFLSIWTQKEAVLKAIGLGMSVPLDSFDVTPFPGLSGSVVAMPDQFGGGRWRVCQPDLLPGFVCAAALSETVTQLSIHDYSRSHRRHR